MLTSFFGKSNPINFLILGAVILIGYFLGAVYGSTELLNFMSILRHFGWLLLCIFLMFLLDFIIRKNKLTRNNTYAVYFFSCFLIMIPSIFLAGGILIANLLSLLALRRIISLRTERNLEKKILDASIYLTFASLFHFWIILYFGILWLGVIRSPQTRFRHLLIPIVGFFVGFCLITTFYLITEDSFAWFFEWFQPPSFDFSAYNEIKLLVPATLLITLLLWTVPHRIYTINSLPKVERPTALFIISTAIFAVATALTSEVKTGAELLFICVPVSILFANYIAYQRPNIGRKRDVTKSWFKEGLLWMLILLPLIGFFI